MFPPITKKWTHSNRLNAPQAKGIQATPNLHSLFTESDGNGDTGAFLNWVAS